MLFNSAVFLQFFAAFLLLYWLVRGHLRSRNLLIVIASYVFYGWWNWKLLSLLIISSVMDYTLGLAMGRTETPGRRKLFLILSMAGNLSILGFFKYFDFFIESFAAVLTQLGLQPNVRTLGIILPAGISFYTFQTMSYTIDVYRRELPPTRDLVNFLAYVSFFPQLVAGPIERARHLLPQFQQTRTITRSMIEEGLWLALWGMFKKVALADNLAPLVELVYGNSEAWSAPAVTLATIAFGFQIYCDFSGYSDIARGTAKVLGFDIMVNFDIPYASSSLREFWRRWHISLSTWLRDYLYIPLGGNQRGPKRTYANLLLTMFLGGLWHGAAWHFILWGVWHGAGLGLERAALGRLKTNGSRFGVARLAGWFATMLFVLYGWLLFRADSFSEIVHMTKALTDFSAPSWTATLAFNLIVFSSPLILIESWQLAVRDHLAPLRRPAWVRAALQGTLLVGILLYWQKAETPFIYFQF